MRSIEEVYIKIKEYKMKKIAVSAAADPEVIDAAVDAKFNGIADSILFGDKQKILDIMKFKNIDPGIFEIYDEKDVYNSSLKAVNFVSEGKADILMKGLIETSAFMKAVLNSKTGLRIKNCIMSSIAILEDKERERLLFITDPGFTPLPDIDTKRKILENAVKVMHLLDFTEPKVAVLSATESVNPRMISSVEAKELEELNIRGEISGCVVAGPISMDLAISKESAKHKGYVHPVAGNADLLLVPTLESGNMLLKGLIHYAHMTTAGIVAGAQVPIVFTSRSDSVQTKLNTIAFAVLLSQRGGSI